MVVIVFMICGCNARELVDVGDNFNGTGFGAGFEVGGAARGGSGAVGNFEFGFNVGAGAGGSFPNP